MDLLKISDVSKMLGVSKSTIYGWIKNNKIDAIKLVGNKTSPWRFHREEIESLARVNGKI